MTSIPARLCSVEGCGNKHFGRGLCNKHYQQMAKSGTLPPAIIRDDTARFWSKVNKNGPIHESLGTRCWLWTAQCSRGYGRIWLKGSQSAAHRYSYELHKGPIPNGMLLCHSCDVRNCVNPEHLWLGSSLENNHDMIDKARHAFGVKNPKAKLQESDILEIRRLSQSGMFLKDIAVQYEIAISTVFDIVKRRRWRHVK